MTTISSTTPIEEEEGVVIEVGVIKISDIKIGERLRKKPSDVSSLAKSIADIGLLHPPVIDENNNLIAGYRRIKAYEQDLGRTEIPFRRINIRNALQGEYEENVERADFALEDIAAIYEQVQKSRIGHRPSKKDNNQKVGESPTFPKGPSDIVTGKIVGYGEQTINKIVEIVEAAKDNPKLQEIVEAVDNGNKSIEYAYKQIKRSEDSKKERRPALPEGQYNVILADPDGAVKMTTEEIMNLDVQQSMIADDAILFIWATAPKLNDAFRVMLGWGFEYKTHAVWIYKDKIVVGTGGYYFRGKHELLLVGTKGNNIGVPAESDRPESSFYAPRPKEHSSCKPVIAMK